MNTPDDGSGGFGDAAKQMSDMEAQQHQFASDVASGNFSIDPDSARSAARACRDQVGEVDRILGRVSGLGDRVSFGDCLVGRAMTGKFADKATGGDASLRTLLERSRTVLTNLAQNYDDAAASYEQTDAANAASYRAE